MNVSERPSFQHAIRHCARDVSAPDDVTHRVIHGGGQLTVALDHVPHDVSVCRAVLEVDTFLWIRTHVEETEVEIKMDIISFRG